MGSLFPGQLCTHHSLLGTWEETSKCPWAPTAIKIPSWSHYRLASGNLAFRHLGPRKKGDAATVGLVGFRCLPGALLGSFKSLAEDAEVSAAKWTMVVVNHLVTEGSLRFLGSLKDSCRENNGFCMFLWKMSMKFRSFRGLHECRGCCGFTMRIRFVYFVFKVFEFWIYLWGHKKTPMFGRQERATKRHEKTSLDHSAGVMNLFPKHSRYRKHICLHLPLKNQPNAGIHWVFGFGITTLEFGVQLSLNSESFFQSFLTLTALICWQFDSQINPAGADLAYWTCVFVLDFLYPPETWQV